MSEFYEFCRDLPWLAFILVCAAYYTVSHVLRAINIAARGWPPEYLDADGDHKKPLSTHNESPPGAAQRKETE